MYRIGIINQFINRAICFSVQLILLGVIFFPSASRAAFNDSIGQIVQIETYFTDVLEKPQWVLILRDDQSRQVSPYLFDIHQKDNFWIALSYAHTYKIVSSTVTFSQYAKIKNFCGSENSVLSGESLLIRLTGRLTPNIKDFHCYQMRYKNMQFKIVPK